MLSQRARAILSLIAVGLLGILCLYELREVIREPVIPSEEDCIANGEPPNCWTWRNE